MSGFLCDTNIISELMRREPSRSVVEWADAQEVLGISVVSLEEIICGLSHKELFRKEEWFRRFVGFRCRVFEIDEEIAEYSGKLRGRFLAAGSQRSQADMLIAATGWKHRLTVVTRNTKDFDGCRIPVLDPFPS